MLVQVPSKLVELAVVKFGRLDGMVINHGTLENKTIASSTLEDFRNTYEVNVFSCLALVSPLLTAPMERNNLSSHRIETDSPIQVKAGLEEIKKTKGAFIWLSSGASHKSYRGWSAYGSSKAVVNSISAHLAAEEPDITSIAIQPGRVNTDMQAIIRATGNGVLDAATYQTFVDAFNDGTLLKPEQPGSVIARVVSNPSKELSGKFMV